jgi:hypothetical protein
MIIYSTSIIIFFITTWVLADSLSQARQSSPSVPWPPIPLQQPYSPPTYPEYIYPTSVVQGLTEQSAANGTVSFPLLFNAVEDIYTRKVQILVPYIQTVVTSRHG